MHYVYVSELGGLYYDDILEFCGFDYNYDAEITGSILEWYCGAPRNSSANVVQLLFCH